MSPNSYFPHTPADNLIPDDDNKERNRDRDKALLIAFSYRSSGDSVQQLNNCARDACKLRDFLVARGYRPENITVLSDETDGPPITREYIVRPTHCVL